MTQTQYTSTRCSNTRPSTIYVWEENLLPRKDQISASPRRGRCQRSSVSRVEFVKQ